MNRNQKMGVAIGAGAGVLALALLASAKRGGSGDSGGSGGGGGGITPGAKCSSQWAAEMAAGAIGRCSVDAPQLCDLKTIRETAREIRACGTAEARGYADELDEYANQVEEYLKVTTGKCDPAHLTARLNAAQAGCTSPLSCNTNLMFQVASELDACGWNSYAAALRDAANDAIAAKQAAGRG